MPGWTKVNFDEVKERSSDPESLQMRFTRDVLGSSELGVTRFRFAPDARMPFGHRHREQEEVYVVVSGSGRFKLDDELIDVAPWDVIRVAPEVGRGFEAGADGLEVICLGGRRPEGGDGERVEGFWD